LHLPTYIIYRSAWNGSGQKHMTPDPPGSESQASTHPRTRRARLKDVLEAWSPRIWPATILITLCILGVALYNLYLVFAADRPKLISTEARLYVDQQANPRELVRFGWANTGKRTAHRGTATLYTIHENGGEPPIKFGVGEINSGGGDKDRIPIQPIFGRGSTTIAVDMSKFLGVFLVCTTYYDDADYQYYQEFLLILGEEQNKVAPLHELAPTKHSHCE
jgi:hypothetical protein